MTTFLVTAATITYTTYAVNADDAEEAVVRFQDGECAMKSRVSDPESEEIVAVGSRNVTVDHGEMKFVI